MSWNPVLGRKVPLPIGLAPVAMTGLQFGNGAQAANDAGIPFALQAPDPRRLVRRCKVAPVAMMSHRSRECAGR
jgi:hypothetical protein